MIKKLKYILLVLFLSFSSNYINAEVMNSVNINGNKRVSDETIKIYGQINDYKKYSEKNANEILIKNSKVFKIGRKDYLQ